LSGRRIGVEQTYRQKGSWMLSAGVDFISLFHHRSIIPIFLQLKDKIVALKL
jgi:hypothetical protein